MTKKHSYTDEQIREAAIVLSDCKINLFVHGCYTLSNLDDVVLFAQHPEQFYFNIAERAAEEIGASTEDYVYYLKYSDAVLYKLIGHSDIDSCRRCSAVTKKGTQCSHPVSFRGDFSEFQKGISDRCTIHRNK